MSLVNTKEALAELWDVEDSGLLHYLSIENSLVAVDRDLQNVLRGFRSSFGGTYLSVKNNTVSCNTVDETKVLIVKSSPLLTQRGYVDFITFKPTPAGISLNDVVILHDPKDDEENENLEHANEFNPTLIVPNILIHTLDAITHSGSNLKESYSRQDLKRRWYNQ
ncbi:hypothetical protein F8M41_003340 [Gigaspora margarita]|uniref:Uncharacterized protein n=1 Tax=Gigaspora margarita TaxID=4874 RepID=A0A8H3XDE5_GIGMA|nr:hypothetical protein F8M41_003340 [Gigaspora margarita]